MPCLPLLPLLLPTVLLPTTSSTPLQNLLFSSPHTRPLPPTFILAGDSTTAPQNPQGGGWGNGFLKTLHHGAHGINLGHNGATTASYIASGAWSDVVDRIVRSRHTSRPYVTIAFGHNDHVALPFAQYVANLRSMGEDVHAAGGVPVFVTPLTQRVYDSRTGLLVDTLHAERRAVLDVAACFAPGEAVAIDLYKASMRYLNSVGKDNACMYGLGKEDDTHLNGGGGVVFGNMVSGLLREGVLGEEGGGGWDIGEYTWPNATIWEAIGKGEFIFPEP